jgi:hypothetical protein
MVLLVRHVQDLIDVDIEFDDVDEILSASVVIGVFDGQHTHDVE